MSRIRLIFAALIFFQTISYSQDSTSAAEVRKTIEKLHSQKEISHPPYLKNNFYVSQIFTIDSGD